MIRFRYYRENANGAQMGMVLRFVDLIQQNGFDLVFICIQFKRFNSSMKFNMYLGRLSHLLEGGGGIFRGESLAVF